MIQKSKTTRLMKSPSANQVLKNSQWRTSTLIWNARLTQIHTNPGWLMRDSVLPPFQTRNSLIQAFILMAKWYGLSTIKIRHTQPQYKSQNQIRYNHSLWDQTLKCLSTLWTPQLHINFSLLIKDPNSLRDLPQQQQFSRMTVYLLKDLPNLFTSMIWMRTAHYSS